MCFLLQKTTTHYVLTITHELEGIKGLEQALNRCCETIVACMPYIQDIECVSAVDSVMPYRNVLRLIPVLLLRLSRDQEAYQFMRLWSQSRSYWTAANAEDMNLTEHVLRRSYQTSSLISADFQYFVDRWFPSIWERDLLREEGAPFIASQKAEILRNAFYMAGKEYKAPIFSLMQPVESITQITNNQEEIIFKGWKHVPTTSDWVMPFVMVHMKFLRDFRGLHNTRILCKLIESHASNAPDPQGRPSQTYQKLANR